MLEIKKFTVNPLMENTYVVSDNSHECVIIDCGVYTSQEKMIILNYINDNNLIPTHLLQTHGHIDHCIGNDIIFNEFGLCSELHINDQTLMNNLNLQSSMIFGESLQITVPNNTIYFTGNDVISFGEHQFSIIETPGHSPGGVFFYCKEEKIAFSGDTLFNGSIGRTDFMGGSMFQIIQSLRMISQLDDDIKIYPGHGDDTTIGYECFTNMYLDR